MREKGMLSSNVSINSQCLNFKLGFMLCSGLVVLSHVENVDAKPYPFPSYPIISQSYINRSTPLFFAYVDNSTTMDHKVNVRDPSNHKDLTSGASRKFAPSRLDLVKSA